MTDNISENPQSSNLGVKVEFAPISRRKFINDAGKASVAALAALSFSPSALPTINTEAKEFLDPEHEVSIGINGFLDNRLTPDVIRIPINRAAFDPLEKIAHLSNRAKDVFYQTGEEVRRLHNNGAHLNLVLEMGDGEVIDDITHLEKMFKYAHDFFKLRPGDKIIIGNEHSFLRNFQGYPVDKYITQFKAITQIIKQAVPGIEVGLQSEAWYGNGEYFKKLISSIKKQHIDFNFVSINYYGSAAEIADRIKSYKDILNRNGYKVPIDVSEVGVRVSDNPAGEKKTYPAQLIVDEDGQANYMVKTMASAIKAGARTIYWFNFQDDVDHSEFPFYGLIDASGKERKALQTYKFVSELFRSMTFVKKESSSLYTRFVFQKDVSRISVCWTNTNQAFSFEPQANSVVYDAFGEVKAPVNAVVQGESHSVFILPKSESSQGGDVRIVVQDMKGNKS